MVPMSARERLSQLIVLASSDTRAERGMLAMELADILTDWPEEYPPHMRESFTILLEKIVDQLDDHERRTLAARLAPNSTTPLTLLNGLFFDTSPDLRGAVLTRNSQERHREEIVPMPVDELYLVQAAREYPPETFVRTLARLLCIPVALAGRAMADANDEGLAILCKGARVSRTTFSTLAMLTDISLLSAERKLERYETVPEEASARMIQFWRAQRDTSNFMDDGIQAA
jgi:hypothetical protein